MSIKRLQLLSNTYYAAHLLHSVSRLISSSNPAAKRNILHTEQMNMISLILKIITAWKSPKGDEVCEWINAKLEAYCLELSMALKKELSSSAWDTTIGVAIREKYGTDADPAAMLVFASYLYFKRNMSPKFSSEIPAIEDWVPTPITVSKKYRTLRALNQKIYLQFGAYASLVESAKQFQTSLIKAVSDSDTATIDMLHLEGSGKKTAFRKNWSTNAVLCQNRNKWTKLLLTGFPSEQIVCAKMQDLMGITSSAVDVFPFKTLMSSKTSILLEPGHCSSTSARDIFDLFVLEIEQLSPTADNEKQRSRAVPAKTEANKLNPAVQLSGKNGTLVVSADIASLLHIYANEKFQKENAEQWQKAKGVNISIVVEDIQDASAAISEVNQLAMKVQEDQASAQKAFDIWSKTSKKKQTVIESFKKMQEILTTMSLTDLKLVLSDKEAKQLKELIAAGASNSG